RVPGLVGWEHHGDPADIAGLEVVAAGKTWTGGDQESHYEATIYPGPKGNTVFNAATIFWCQALASPPGHWIPYTHNGRSHGPDRRGGGGTKKPPLPRGGEGARKFRPPRNWETPARSPPGRAGGGCRSGRSRLRSCLSGRNVL